MKNLHRAYARQMKYIYTRLTQDMATELTQGLRKAGLVVES